MGGQVFILLALTGLLIRGFLWSGRLAKYMTCSVLFLAGVDFVGLFHGKPSACGGVLNRVLRNLLAKPDLQVL